MKRRYEIIKAGPGFYDLLKPYVGKRTRHDYSDSKFQSFAEATDYLAQELQKDQRAIERLLNRNKRGGLL